MRTIYIDPDGEEYGAMPRIWNNASPITWEYLEENGWTKREELAPVPEPEPKVYSKYKIKCALVDLGIWPQVKAAIEQAGFWDSFLLIQDISSDNPEFMAALPLLAQAFPGVDIAALLADCEV